MTEDTNSLYIDVETVQYLNTNGEVIASQRVGRKPLRIWDKDSITTTTVFNLVPGKGLVGSKVK